MGHSENIKKAQITRKLFGQRPTQSLEEKFSNNPTRKNAIGAKCVDCVGGSETEGYRTEVKLCPIPECPLYNFRPYKLKVQP